MRLLGFRYLKRQRVLTLALIIIMSSMLFSLTAFSLLGFYRGFTAYLGEGKDIIVVYDKKSQTPFTGLVPAYLSEKIGTLNGVLASSPEVIAPCVLKDKSIFLRGIKPEVFLKLNRLTMIEGEMIKLEDLNYVVVGKGVAKKLRLSTGDKILVLGVLSNLYLELRVKGIFASNSPMDDEILAPLYVGQWLRGADYGHVTLIRFKIDRNMITPERIFEEIAKEASQPSPPSPPSQGQKTSTLTPSIITRFRVEDIGVKEAYDFMKNYMDKYGVTRESLLILSVMVFFFSSASIATAFKTLIAQHRSEINILRSIGASKKLLKRDMLIKLLAWSVAASSLGLIIALAILSAIQINGHLQVLSHTVTFQIDPLIIALNFALVSLLVSISILRSEMG